MLIHKIATVKYNSLLVIQVLKIAKSEFFFILVVIRFSLVYRIIRPILYLYTLGCSFSNLDNL